MKRNCGERKSQLEQLMNSEEPWGNSGDANTSAFEADGCRFEPCRASQMLQSHASIGAAPPHRREPLVEEVGEVRDAKEPVGGREPARILALAGKADRVAPLL